MGVLNFLIVQQKGPQKYYFTLGYRVYALLRHSEPALHYVLVKLIQVASTGYLSYNRHVYTTAYISKGNTFRKLTRK